jgi:HEAT repeat protein
MLVVAGGCRYPRAGFESPEPAQRIGAVTEAARTRDRQSVPHLISLLRSDDPLVRMMSIRTLELITGETLGYDHAASEREREAAVDRWVAWYRAQGGQEPAGGAGGGVDHAGPEDDLRF